MKAVLRPNRSRCGQALIGLIIVIAIIIGMSAYFSQRHGVYQNAEVDASMTACGVYTSQIREAIMMYKQDNGSYPPSLQALKKHYGIVDEMIAPPCTYGYDPATGTLTPPSSRPGDTAPTAAAQPAAQLTYNPAAPAGTPDAGRNGGPAPYNGTTIAPMAGTPMIHIPGSVTGGGPSNSGGGGGGDNN